MSRHEGRTDAPQGHHPAARHGLPSWARHADGRGTVAVAGVLHDLERDGWTALPAPGGPAARDDLRRPGRTEDATGHVLVGPGGVVVVDARPAPGRRQDAATVADAEQCAARSAAVVTSLLAPRHRSAVRAVVCLVDGSRPSADVVRDAAAAGAAPGVGALAGAVVTGEAGLAAWLRSLPPRLHAQDVAGLAQHLGLTLTLPPDVLTTRSLETDRRVARRRAVGPLTAGTAAPQGDARGATLSLVLRAGVVVSTAWLAWVFTTAPLGLG